MILINFELKSGFFSRDISTTSSPRRRSLDGDLREQLSQLAVEFRLNVSPRSERLAKPLPAIPPHISNRRPAKVQAKSKSSGSLSREAGVGQNHDTQLNLNGVSGEEPANEWSAREEQTTAEEGTDAAEEASLPLNHMTTPERDLIVSPSTL
jgi:hypothetical protein